MDRPHARPLKIGLTVLPFEDPAGLGHRWTTLRAVAQRAEAVGFDSLWIPDHPMATGSATWTHLAAMAEATKRVRLGPLVACVAYANPVIVARAVADLDLISGGRAVLGLGSGDMPHEFAQMGSSTRPQKCGRRRSRKRFRSSRRC